MRRRSKSIPCTGKEVPSRYEPGDAEAEKKFKEASEAYAVLSDPEKRQKYDQFGHAAFDGGAGGAGGFGGFDFSGADFSDISAIFSATCSAAEDEAEEVTDRCEAQMSEKV